MALVAAEFSTGTVTLSTTVADAVTLYRRGSHKLSVSNVTGTAALHFTINDVATAAVSAVGTLTLAINPTAGDTFTVGGLTCTFVSALTGQTGNEILIGSGRAVTKTHIEQALGLIDGGEGSTYSRGMAGLSDATAAAFSVDDMAFTAVQAGIPGNTVVFTETFTSGSNVMDGSGVLGGTTAGVNATLTAATSSADTYVVPAGATLEIHGTVDGIQAGAVGLSIVGSGNVYAAQLLG